jgi:hypothetical protein
VVARQEAASRDEVCRGPLSVAFCTLMCASGDGTLSVMDVRSKKSEPFTHSEDQEDELLSIVPFKG